MTAITRQDMATKLEKTLRLSGDLYTLDDIMVAIEEGRMQSFTVDDTWIITQVLEFPRRKVLEITFVIGFLNEAVKALPALYAFARSIGATRVTGFGREGWMNFAEPGWKLVGSMYAKELTDGG